MINIHFDDIRNIPAGAYIKPVFQIEFQIVKV